MSSWKNIKVSPEMYEAMSKAKGDKSFDAYLRSIHTPLDSAESYDRMHDLELGSLKPGEFLTVPIAHGEEAGVEVEKFWSHIKYLRYKKKISLDVQYGKRLEDGRPTFVITRLA